MILTAWNYQGIGQSSTARALSDLIKSKNLEVTYLSETKCSVADFWKNSKFKKWKMDSVDSVGLFGGLIILWKNHISLKIIDKCSRFIEVEILNDKGNDVWTCLLVYGKLDSNHRLRFFEHIVVKIQSIQNPLICIGD